MSHRILIIDRMFPAYDRSSGALRAYNLIRMLREDGYHVTFIARHGQNQEPYQHALERLGVEIYATDPEKLARIGLKVTASPLNFPHILASGNFDLAILSYYDIAAQYLEEIRSCSPQTKIIIDTVDVHFVREQRHADLLLSSQLLTQAAAIKRLELAVYRQADLVVTVTGQDGLFLADQLPGLPVAVLPTIHPVVENPVPFNHRDHLLFVGNFAHNPNIDAMLYFCSQVFPQVQQYLPAVKLFIVGNHPPEEIRRLAGPNIVVTGYVPDLQVYYQKCRVDVAPLRFGAGMKGKISEAMAAGLPVVTTTIGAEGMNLTHGQNALITDDPRRLAEVVAFLYYDPWLWEKISFQAREHVRRHYSPVVFREKYLNLLKILGTA